MNEGAFHGLYFAIVLFTYLVKPRIDREGRKAGRGTVREGIISGLSAYTDHFLLLLETTRGGYHHGIIMDRRLAVGSRGVVSIAREDYHCA